MAHSQPQPLPLATVLVLTMAMACFLTHHFALGAFLTTFSVVVLLVECVPAKHALVKE